MLPGTKQLRLFVNTVTLRGDTGGGYSLIDYRAALRGTARFLALSGFEAYFAELAVFCQLAFWAS